MTKTSLTQDTTYKYDYIDNLYNIKQIKVISNYNKKESLVCILFSDGTLKYTTFYYPGGWLGDSGHFNSLVSNNFNCRNSLYGLKLNYITNNQTIVLSCIDNISKVQASFFNDELYIQNLYEQFTNFTSIYGHSVLISKLNFAYFVISDAICENIKRCFEPLEGALNPIQIINITSSFQILDSIEETNEKTEIIEEKFNCSELEKCSECDKESFDNNLCIKCSNKKNYYYLNDLLSKEQTNKYIDCVNETTKPSNFYFNQEKLFYEQCYITCASCEYGGNSEENNCTSCDEILLYKRSRKRKK